MRLPPHDNRLRSVLAARRFQRGISILLRVRPAGNPGAFHTVLTLTGIVQATHSDEVGKLSDAKNEWDEKMKPGDDDVYMWNISLDIVRLGEDIIPCPLEPPSPILHL